jgi:hypothetical protein
MPRPKKYDFSGYATKTDVLCTDGRTIKPDAFKHEDGKKVSIVWQHLHDDPDNILGHGFLENRPDGTYLYGVFNDTEKGEKAKKIVKHGDISALSIYANRLVQKGKDVIHGNIVEVSLVLSGANSGAIIDNLVLSHGDNTSVTIDDEAIISFMLDDNKIEHGDSEPEKEPEESTETMQEVYDSLNEKQKTVVHAMIASALTQTGEEDDDVEHSDNNDDSEGGAQMKRNVFEQPDTKSTKLSHADLQVILDDAKKMGSLKESFLAHAADYGFDNQGLEVLFPEAQMVGEMEWKKREDDWVAGVLSGVSKTPFARIKSMFADIDIATARARGYIKAHEKKEIYLTAAKRVTTPTTIYVKQKLDRDDILDITDFDIVAMVKYQLRTVLEEELAQAYLIGDGRDLEDPEHISEDNIRPIWKEDDMYCLKHKLSTKTDYKVMVKEISLANEDYRGSGAATLYTTPGIHANMLWIEDTTGRRIYETDAQLTAALAVSKIVEIPQIQGKIRKLTDNSERQLLAIKVNLKDYKVGAVKGGEVATFDDFDIDFNQYKYLMETRQSAALTKLKSAQVFEFETKPAS